MDIATRFEEIRDRVDQAARRAGREPDSVRLIAISKTRSADEIEQVLKAGATDVGENKVQEAQEKRPQVEREAQWHFVGHLQKNKAKAAVDTFELIHSVHSASLGKRLDRLAGSAGKTQRALIQVDLAGERTKFGLPSEQLESALEELGECEHLSVEGLMVLPPHLEDPNDVRPYFRRLRELGERAAAAGLLEGKELSMGMSHDFEVAIEEGATFVRIGTALFGPRARAPEETHHAKLEP